MDTVGAQPVYSVDRNNDGTGMGSGLIWIIFLFFIIAFANNSGMFSGNGRMNCASTQDVNSGFNFQSVQSDLRALERGQCQSGYENAMLINGVNSNITNGVSSIINGINTLGYNNQQCCCDINRNIDNLRFENSKNTCEIVNVNNQNTQKIIDTITQNEIQRLRDELADARLKISNTDQTATLVSAIRPTPIPAYITCSPYSTAYYGYNNGCNGCYNGCYNYSCN